MGGERREGRCGGSVAVQGRDWSREACWIGRVGGLDDARTTGRLAIVAVLDGERQGHTRVASVKRLRLSKVLRWRWRREG